MRTQIYNLNLNVGIGIPPSVKVSQGDINRTIGFRIYEGARAYIPGSNDAVIITGTKPSGLGFTETCQINGTLITVATTTAMTQESGKIDAELRISNGTYDIGTANFVLYVEPAPHQAGTTDGTTEEARTVLEQCAQYAQEAQAAAGEVPSHVHDLVDAAVADKMEEIEDAVQSVTDASTQAVTDINAAGEEVIESIPADYTALSTQVSQLQADLIDLQGGGYIADQQKISERINSWLNEHPEATTTVQDGSLTETKLSDSLKKLVLKDYVTPEMFGAVGDGVTDDYNAISDAINNEEGRCVYFSNKTYLTSQSISLTKNPIINDGVIKYSGTDYALILSPSTAIDGAYYNLGNITALNGNCLKLDSTNGWMQYITFDFLRLVCSATGNCVYAKVVGNNWINEIRFLNGRFYGALNGVYIDHSEKASALYTSHWTFDKVGFEGVTNGLNIPDKVLRTSFTNCRAEESLTNVVFSRANTFLINQSIVWFGTIANGNYWKNCNNYVVTFLSGFINERGVSVSIYPIVFKDNMLYGIPYDGGENGVVANYGAYSYDAETTIQTVDFKDVYDYSTLNTYLYYRPFVRKFAIGNNAEATKTNIYLDDRMFLDDVNCPANSYLLTLTLSPNVVLTIYDKEGGEVLYTKTGGSGATYLKIKISKTRKTYYIENLDISFKTVS